MACIVGYGLVYSFSRKSLLEVLKSTIHMCLRYNTHVPKVQYTCALKSTIHMCLKSTKHIFNICQQIQLAGLYLTTI